MAKRIVFFISIIAGTFQWASAQTLNFSSVRNVYSTPSFLEDTLTKFGALGLGYRLSDGNGRAQSHYLKQVTPVTTDTNAYSVVDFKLANASQSGKATQSIGVALHRPLSKRSALGFGLNRTSNAGWVAQGFVRKTEVETYYEGSIGERWKTTVDGLFSVRDREQNGGFVDSMFVFGVSPKEQIAKSANVSLFNKANPAYNRITNHSIGIENEALLFDGTSRALSAGFKTEGTIFKYEYNDPFPDSVYYSTYSNGAWGALAADSFNIHSVLVSPYAALRFGEQDSTDEKPTEIRLGLNQRWFWVRNNESFRRPVNQSVFVHVGTENGSRSLAVVGELHMVGANAGDYHTEANFRQWLLIPDSTNVWGVALTAHAGLTESKPGVVFQHYRSTVGSVSNLLRRVRLGHYAVCLGVESVKTTLGFSVDYSNLNHYVYFDQVANVHQASSPIDLYGAQLRLGYEGKLLTAATNVRYQWNNRSKIYSLPEWVNTSTVALRWAMFQKKLGVSTGLNSAFYSGYVARGYHPLYDSYYVQTAKRFGDYFQLDAFAYVHIGAVDLGLNVINLGYGLIGFNTNEFPYYPTVAPGYANIPRYFQLHINWRLKN